MKHATNCLLKANSGTAISGSVSDGLWPASCVFPGTMEIAQWAHSSETGG